MSVNPMFQACSKHIKFDFHFVQEKVAIGTLVTYYVFTYSQLADIFIKSLSNNVFIMFRTS